MPFNEQAKLQRRDSWPPTIVRIRDDEAADETSAIDENPFSFFLTSPEDLDEDDEDLSAGIESSTSKTPQVREISPSALRRPRLALHDDDDDEEEYQYDLALPLSLKDFSLRHTDGRESRQEHRSTEESTTFAGAGLGIAIPGFATAKRGRTMVRLTLARRGRGGGRGQTRSLSARRPHSWKVPNLEIGTIKEERESDEDERPKQELQVPAPPNTEEIVPEVEVVKPGKRVHWA